MNRIYCAVLLWISTLLVWLAFRTKGYLNSFFWRLDAPVFRLWLALYNKDHY